MTTLIIIRGVQNSGKTTIARRILDDLQQYATAIRYFDKNLNEVSIPILGKDVPIPDFYAVLTIRRQTFMIVSGGDSLEWVRRGIDLGWKMRVDGIVQCVRSTIKPAMNYIKKNCKYMPKIEYKTRKYKSKQKRDAQILQIMCDVRGSILPL